MGADTELWKQWESLYKKNDWAGLTAMFTSNGVFIDPYGRREGRDTVGAFIAGWDKAFSDISMETSLVVGDDDTVMVEWTFRAMNTGPLGPGVAATGRTLVVEVVTVGRIRDGNITSIREYYDTADVTRQLG